MRFLICTLGWVSCAFFALPSLTSTSTPSAYANPHGKRGKKINIKKCMRFSQQLGSDEESVDIKLTNQCRQEVMCTVEWKVVCGNGGAVASTNKRSTTLETAQSLELNASAASCEEDWAVEDVGWSCAPL